MLDYKEPRQLVFTPKVQNPDSMRWRCDEGRSSSSPSLDAIASDGHANMASLGEEDKYECSFYQHKVKKVKVGLSIGGRRRFRLRNIFLSPMQHDRLSGQTHGEDCKKCNQQNRLVYRSKQEHQR